MYYLVVSQPIEIHNDKQFRRAAYESYTDVSAISYSEFEQDLRKFAYTAKMMRIYNQDPMKVSERFLINQIIIIHNTFGRFTTTGLFYKTDKKDWKTLKTFLDYLEYIPVEDDSINQIDTDYQLTKLLEKL